MVQLDEYYRVWKWRVSDLKEALRKIKLLPKDSRIMQALIVRNACLDFISELETAFEIILTDYVRRQDELFLATVDDINLAEFNKKPWPLSCDLPVRLLEQKKSLREDVKKWANQAAEFETTILLVQAAYRVEIYVIIGELTNTYGVSPRAGKRKR